MMGFGTDRDGWVLRLGPARVHWHTPSRFLWVGLKGGWGLALGVWRW